MMSSSAAPAKLPSRVAWVLARGLHLVQQIEQGMMTESREAGGNATDIYQIIGFYHDESGSDDGLFHLLSRLSCIPSFRISQK